MGDNGREDYDRDLNKVTTAGETPIEKDLIRRELLGRNYFTTRGEIFSVTSELSNEQSPGMDGIPNKLYKDIPSFIYAYLSSLIKCDFYTFFLASSLAVVVFPKLKFSWKIHAD